MADLKFIPRLLSEKIREIEPYYPVTVLTGPRQSGKTTLLKHLYPDYSFVNLEQPSARHYATEDAEGFLDSLGEKAIIDEVQNVPDILSAIQARVDMRPELRYKLTGSCDFSLMHTVSQSLAGRASLFTLLPFSFEELSGEYKAKPTDELEFNGFYPGVVNVGIPPEIFFSNYYQTYIQRDVRQLLQVKDIDKFHRFIRLLAGRTGTELNASTLGVEAGVSSPTVASWVSILKTSYIIFDLPPYYANINKRLTKSAKVYFHDTGLLCYLLGIRNASQLDSHPLRGAVFENMVVSEMVKRSYNRAELPSLTFYREKSGREIDVIDEGVTPAAMYEVKASRTFRPEFTDNMKKVSEILSGTWRQTVVYDGQTLGANLINYRDL